VSRNLEMGLGGVKHYCRGRGEMPTPRLRGALAPKRYGGGPALLRALTGLDPTFSGARGH
jgi:hypothetical protein